MVDALVSSYPHHGFGVVAQLIERYVRIVEVVGLSPISSTKIMPPLGGFLLRCFVNMFSFCEFGGRRKINSGVAYAYYRITKQKRLTRPPYSR